MPCSTKVFAKKKNTPITTIGHLHEQDPLGSGHLKHGECRCLPFRSAARQQVVVTELNGVAPACKNYFNNKVEKTSNIVWKIIPWSGWFWIHVCSSVLRTVPSQLFWFARSGLSKRCTPKRATCTGSISSSVLYPPYGPYGPTLKASSQKHYDASRKPLGVAWALVPT